MSDPPTISAHFILAGSGTIPGGDAMTGLLDAGLTVTDDHGDLRPQLAERVPSVENGFWTVHPDGTMETVWKIRGGAQWHDGLPLTSDDILFTAGLAQDRDLTFFHDPAIEPVAAVDALDAQTVRVAWARPYIQADHPFGLSTISPRPRHLLEPILQSAEDKTSVFQAPYWTTDFVGAGPFRLREWVRGSHLIMEANDAYVLGRPHLDEIEVRFIPDPNALVANVLAGTVELTMGRNISLQQAMQLRDSWRDGRIDVGFTDWIALYPQLLNPSPAVLSDVDFRRALLYGLDREQLVETLQYGLVPVAHSFVNPNESVYPEIEDSVVKYPYDPRRATQLIEGLGYAKAGDGIYRDAVGQQLSLEVRTSGGDDTQESGVISAADAYKRFGIAAEPYLIPQAQRNDREYNATYPGLRLWRLPNDLGRVDRYASSDAPLPENHFSGANRSRYINPEFDALVDAYMTTIPLAERVGWLRQIVHHMTDRVIILGLWYNTEAIVIANRITGVANKRTGDADLPWNAEQWDVKNVAA